MITVKTKILKMLKEADGYVSGQDICEELHVSRTAVWKVIKQLQEEGYQIEAVRNKGYCLEKSADVITKAELSSCMDSQWMGKNLVYYDETDSTNTRAKALAEQGALSGTLVVADCQMSGKGRRGRSWVSPRFANIYMTLILKPQISPSCASMLTLTAAMAVLAGIKEVTGLETEIKWPNDLVYGGKKVCGILTEMSAELDCIHYVVIGMGINVNLTEIAEEVAKTATSLRIEAGQPVSRSALIAAVIRWFEVYYQKFLETEDLSLLMEEYNEKLANQGREVRVLAPSGDYCAVSRGINKSGELLVELEDGTLQKVVSGEVSVRGIYGYV